MRRAMVSGAGGFVGSHLVKYLKKKGWWVRGVDLKYPEWSKTHADHFLIADLRNPFNCQMAVDGAEEVYDLAADMGGMGFITGNDAPILHNNTLISTNMIEVCRKAKVKRYFFSSSVCVYPTYLMKSKIISLNDKNIYPAYPQGGYGWQKLTHERRCAAYMRELGLEVRIARFNNCYGPEGTYQGGREKVPAALSRKVIEAEDGGRIDVWGDGKQVRNFMYIEDCVRWIYKLMRSDHRRPISFGDNRLVTVNELAELIIGLSGRKLGIKHVDGPEGVKYRAIDSSHSHQLFGKPKYTLEQGLKETYRWINDQIKGTN